MTSEANTNARNENRTRMTVRSRDFESEQAEGTNPEAGAIVSTDVHGDTTDVQAESYTQSYTLPAFGKWLDDLCQEDA